MKGFKTVARLLLSKTTKERSDHLSEQPHLLKKSGLGLVMATMVLPTTLVFPTLTDAAVVGASDSSFYTAPTTTGNAGDLISYRTATVNLGAGAAATQAWNVMYRSTDALGAANVVSGTVIVPTAAWTGSGARPVIDYAVGTHGLAEDCAPSRQMAQGTDYENANIAAAIAAGYAVLVSDNPGYTNGSTPTYLAGIAQGHAILDIAKAATQIPNAGISSTAKTAIWGYSQGGQTASWAGEMQSSYAPNLNLVGIAAGGIPGNFLATANYLNGSTGSSFMLAGVIGLATQYPTQIPINSLTNAAGQAAITQAKTQCVFQSLFPYMNKNISQYTLNNQTLAQLVAIPSIGQTLNAQNLGTGKPSVPLYQYHGQADEFIPLDQSIALKKTYCSKFSNVTFALYPGEHIATQFQAAPYVLSWLTDRFNNKATLGNCIELAATPTSTANPGGGNFVVSLNNWGLSATIGLKTLAQNVVLPSTSTLTATTDMTAQTITGNLSVPNFQTNLNIGLPVTVALSVTPAGPISGTASLDSTGQLHVHGNALVNINVVSAGEGSLQIPFGCQLSSPASFPINFDGPISSLGNGKLTFTGTTTFAPMTGCGVWNGLFTTLMSGAGQTYTFTATPPAPVAW